MCSPPLLAAVLILANRSDHDASLRDYISFRVGSNTPKLRISLFEVRMVSLLNSWMCFQNGRQQADGVVGYQQFPLLNQFDTDAAAIIVAFCDAAIHFAQTNVEVHKVTRMRIITDCISPATRLGLNIFCRGCGIATLCEYRSGTSFVFDDDHPDNWPTYCL